MLQVSFSPVCGQEAATSSVEVPLLLLESREVWDEVISLNTWCRHLSDSEREHLSDFLPDLPKEQERENIEQLFARREFVFGSSPLTRAFYALKQLTPQHRDWVLTAGRQGAKHQHHTMTLHYVQILAGLCDPRKRSHPLEDVDQSRKKVQKVQTKLWKRDKPGYDTEKAKRDRVKTLLQMEVPPLPYGTTASDVETRVGEIMNRRNFVPPLDKSHPTLPILIKNRPKIKVKSKPRPKLRPTKPHRAVLKINHAQESPAYPSSLLVDCSPSCFFLLVKLLFDHAPGLKLSLDRLESEVSQWLERREGQETGGWEEERENWADLAQSALCYLSVETGAYSALHTPADLFPVVELKDRIGQWEWVGQGRDQDHRLESWCRHWSENLDKARDSILDYSYKPPRPPIYPSSKPVQVPSPEPLVTSFRAQESLRYQNPHKSFTYNVNSNRSVVAPVKGVVSKERAGFKVREHALLESTRPPCVTILTLVRDAVARLQDGEGTRQDICHLVQDSQYISNSASEFHINAAVSGALDRLHYEKDPCVRFENNLKLWVYLHRYRSEKLFNEIHHLQINANKVRKRLINQIEKDRSRLLTPAPSSSPLNDLDELSEDSHPLIDTSHPVEPSSVVSSPSFPTSPTSRSSSSPSPSHSDVTSENSSPSLDSQISKGITAELNPPNDSPSLPSPLYLPHHPSSSLLNRGLVEVGHENERVSLWEVVLSLLTHPNPPSEVLEYVAVYTGTKNNTYIPPGQMETHFYLVKKYALMLPELFPSGVINLDQTTISLTILQIKCLLCHMLLGSLPHCLDWKEDFNASAYYAKVLLYYLSLDIDASGRCVTCTRHTTSPSQWDQLPDKLPPCQQFVGRIEDHPAPIKVVFSNKNFGPGPGGTQEELIFGSYPEACAFPLLFSRPLGDSEVVVMVQVLRVADYEGYGKEVQFKTYLDPFAKCHTLLLMDALEVDMFEDKNEEFTKENISRELEKCFCGFSQFSGREVVTGKWGCGAFGGTFSLKKRIQLFAASRAKVELIFCETEVQVKLL